MARINLVRLPGAKRSEVSKSSIVEAALLMALEGFEVRGPESELAIMLLDGIERG